MMVYQITDLDLWEKLKSSISGHKKRHQMDIPKRLYVVRNEKTLPHTLDLHGYTVQDAFDKTGQFILRHYQSGSRQIIVITGKGTTGPGLIHNEFTKWLEHPKLSKMIQSYCWQNSGGAVKINLKKH